MPVILLARLAVDHRIQGRGLGTALLQDALRRHALSLAASIGVFAVEVVAVDEQAAAFYSRFGFTSLLDDPQHMYLPIKTIERAIS